MQIKSGNHKTGMLICVFFFCTAPIYSQKSLKSEFIEFCDQLQSRINQLSNSDYLGSSNLKRNQSWMFDHFFDNAIVFNECYNKEQHIEDYVESFLPALQSRINDYFMEINLIGPVNPESGNNEIYTARVKKIIRHEGTVVYEANVIVKFVYSGSIKVISIKNENTFKNNLPFIQCHKIKQNTRKIYLDLGIAMSGVCALASSYYFANQSSTYYREYLDNFPSSTSAGTYHKANKNHHAKLILRYAGIGMVVGGSTLYIKNKLNQKKYRSLSNINFDVNTSGFVFQYSF